MIYLTGQLLFFLLITAFVGFLIGWLLRGAMLPASMFEKNEYTYNSSVSREKSRYQFVNQGRHNSVVEHETVDS